MSVPVETGPPVVVTPGLRVLVSDHASGRSDELILVAPGESRPQAGLVSVQSPLGLALLGAQVGAHVTHASPGGTRRLVVDAITVV